MIHTKNIFSAGAKLDKAKKVMIAIHGRGSSAEDILQLASALADDSFALLAPQAMQNSWYPYSFLASAAQNEPGLSSAISVLEDLVGDIVASGISYERIYLMGFSQGACLTLEFATRQAKRYGGVIAFTGGLIGDRIYPEKYTGNFEGTPVYIGASDVDPHVPLSRVYASENIIREKGGQITVDIFPGMAHTINQQEMVAARKILLG